MGPHTFPPQNLWGKYEKLIHMGVKFNAMLGVKFISYGPFNTQIFIEREKKKNSDDNPCHGRPSEKLMN